MTLDELRGQEGAFDEGAGMELQFHTEFLETAPCTREFTHPSGLKPFPLLPAGCDCIF